MKRAALGLVVVAVALAVLIVATSAFTPMNSDDIFMYLELGRRIFSGGLPATDPFLYSIPDYHWHVLHEWGSYVIYDGIYLMGGIDALIFFKSLLIGFMAALAVWPAARERKFLPLLLLPVAAYAGNLRFTEKASLFSDVFTILILFLGFHPMRDRKPFLWTLPILFLVWSNLHPGFHIGLIILGLLAISQIISRDRDGCRFTLKILFLSMIACCCNPMGWAGFIYPVEKILNPDWAIFRTHFFEWMPTFAPGSITIREVQALLIVWTVTAISLIANWKRKPLFATFVFFLMVAIGASAVRFMLVSGFACLLIFSHELSMMKNIVSARARSCGWLATLGLQIFLFSWLLNEGYTNYLGHIEVGGGIKETVIPVAAVDFIEKHHLEGNIFNETDWGSYLAWRWRGTRKIFYHGHIDDPSFLKNEYMKIYRTPAEFDQLVKSHDVRIFLMRTMRLTPGHSTVLRNLVDEMARGQWRVVYSDPNASVVIKTKN